MWRTVAGLVLLFMFLYMALHTSSVQTFLTKRIAAYLSHALETTVTVQGVDVELFNSLVIEGVYVADLKQDTLLYVESLTANVCGYDLGSMRFDLGQIRFSNGFVNFAKYPGDSVFNYQFIVDHYSTDGPVDSTAANVSLAVDELALSGMRFNYVDHNDTNEIEIFNPSDIRVDQLNLVISDFSLANDTLNLKISEFRFEEHSGIKVEHMAFDLKMAPDRMDLTHMVLALNNSRFASDVGLTYRSYDDFSDFVNRVKLNFEVQESSVELADLAYFVPDMKGIDYKLVFAGTVKGRLKRIIAEDLYLQFGAHSYFKGHADITGVQDISTATVNFNIEELKATMKDIEKIPLMPFDAGELVQLPSNLRSLKYLRYSGDFKGQLDHFKAEGELLTGIGKLEANLDFVNDTLFKTMDYTGSLSVIDFDLGAISGVASLGTVSMRLDLDGRGFTREDINTNVKAEIDHFVFERYYYEDVKVQGHMEDLLFEGALAVNDKHLIFDFNGKVDFRGDKPDLHFLADLRKADLYNLHLDQEDPFAELSTCAEVNCQGSSLEDIVGKIRISDTKLRSNNKHFEMDFLTLIADHDEMGQHLKLKCDYMAATLNGNYDSKQITNGVTYLISKALPRYFSEEHTQKPLFNQSFTYSLNLFDVEEVTRSYLPEIVVFDTVRIEGDYRSEAESMSLVIETQSLTIKGKEIVHFEVDAGVEAGMLKMLVHVDSAMIGDSIGLGNISLNAKAISDHVQFGVTWDNEDHKQYSGRVSGLAEIAGLSKIDLSLSESYVIHDGNEWKITGNNHLYVDSTSCQFDHMQITDGTQSVSVNGKISADPTDVMTVAIDSLDVAQVNAFIAESGFTFEGMLNGELALADLYGEQIIQTNLNIDSTSINGHSLGSGAVSAHMKGNQKSAVIYGAFKDDQRTYLEIKGEYILEGDQNFDLTVALDELPLDILQPVLKENLPIFTGGIGGNLKVTGSPSSPELNGSITLHHTEILIGYLNSYFRIDGQTIGIMDDMMYWDEIKIKDGRDSVAVSTGAIMHDNFQNFNMEIVIRADRPFMFMNTEAKHNDLFYGAAIMDSTFVRVDGYANNLEIDVKARTAKGAQFVIPLSNPSEVGESDFIMFVDPNAKNEGVQEGFEVDLAGITMKFDLEITEKASVQIILDEKVGDIIRARGKGNLKLEINDLGEFNIYGPFEIVKGDYLFTLQNILNKKFVIKPGGTIVWNGNALDGEMNVEALYKVRTSVKELLGENSAVSGRRIPIDCVLRMQGGVLEPDITFGLAYPDLDNNTADQLNNAITSGVGIDKQVFALLIMNQFIGSENNIGSNVGSAGKSTPYELMSNQISNWLSQISDDFDLGFNYQAKSDVDGEEVANEVQLALSTQLFNDRITIESNVGVSGSNESTADNIVGDFKVEYRIDDEGKLKGTVFHESNDTYVDIQTGKYTQGVGLEYKEEFDTWKEFFKKVFGLVKNKD